MIWLITSYQTLFYNCVLHRILQTNSPDLKPSNQFFMPSKHLQNEKNNGKCLLYVEALMWVELEILLFVKIEQQTSWTATTKLSTCTPQLRKPCYLRTKQLILRTNKRHCVKEYKRAFNWIDQKEPSFSIKPDWARISSSGKWQSEIDEFLQW